MHRSKFYRRRPVTTRRGPSRPGRRRQSGREPGYNRALVAQVRGIRKCDPPCGLHSDLAAGLRASTLPVPRFITPARSPDYWSSVAGTTRPSQPGCLPPSAACQKSLSGGLQQAARPGELRNNLQLISSRRQNRNHHQQAGRERGMRHGRHEPHERNRKQFRIRRRRRALPVRKG